MDRNNRQQTQNPSRNGTPDNKTFVIDARQSSFIISSTIIGVGVLTLPRVSIEYGKESGWMSTILGAFVAMVAVYFMTKLANKFPGQGLISFGTTILGSRKHPMVGRVLMFPFFLFYFLNWGFTLATAARTFGEVVITTVLPRTPLEVVISTMLLTAFLFVMHDVEVLARVNEILLPIIILPILIIALSSYQSAKLENIFPLFNVDWISFFKAIAATSVSYLGFEVMLVFFGHTQPSGKLMRANLIGIAFPGVLYTLIVISGISVFGVDELKMLAWPTLELVKTTEVPGLILERLESAFLGVWVAAVFTTVGNMFYATSLITKQMFNLKSHRWIALIWLPVLYWLSLQPPNIQKLFEYQNLLGYYGGAGIIIIPCILLLISLIRKQGRKQPVYSSGDSGNDSGASTASQPNGQSDEASGQYRVPKSEQQNGQQSDQSAGQSNSQTDRPSGGKGGSGDEQKQ